MSLEQPAKGQRWLKRGTKTSTAVVLEFFEAIETPMYQKPWVHVLPKGGLPVLLDIDQFHAEYEGPLPAKQPHDERVEYVPMIDPPDERAWVDKRRLKVRVEGRGSNRRLAIIEQWESRGAWRHFDSDACLYLAPDEARLLRDALTKVLRRKGESE